MAATSALNENRRAKVLAGLAAVLLLGACQGGADTTDDAATSTEIAPRSTSGRRSTPSTTTAPRIACPAGEVVISQESFDYEPGPGAGGIQSWSVSSRGTITNRSDWPALVNVNGTIVSTTGLESHGIINLFSEDGNLRTGVELIEPGETIVWSLFAPGTTFLRFGEFADDEPDALRLIVVEDASGWPVPGQLCPLRSRGP